MQGNSDIVLSVKNVSKCFEMYEKPVHRLYQTLCAGRKKFYKEFWALKDVSFKLKKGDRMGVLGFNGAGKSTLLKTIAGVLKPTQGSVHTAGVIAPMLAPGAGFDSNYSGRENVFLYAATMGFSRKFIQEKYDEIVEFSELGDFIDAPIKSYSSGMRSRLGFAIATSVKPEVLILDEVLSVGDAAFREKSERRLESLMSDGVTVLFVSHSTDNVERICNKAMILTQGQLVANGDCADVCALYRHMVNNK